MKISQKTIEEIFNVAIIEDVIADFVVLKKRGANYKGLSPFNDEKTPSFVVSPSKDIWKDFSSGKGGNLISFLMEHEQYSYPEALLFLAKKYNINVEYVDLNPEAQKRESEREAIMIVMGFIKDIFCKNLFNQNSIALDYLKSRGFNEDMIRLFELGYCPRSDKEIVRQVKSAGYNIKYLHKARIINEKEYNRFGGRLIFPIHSISGQVLGYGGRILSSNSNSVKYLNSDTSEIYQKSKVLYGLHLAKKHIKTCDKCYLVEGYTDVIAMCQVDVKNVVANCGTALTKEQVRLIKRFTNNIIIFFDSDEAGISATLKAIDLILQQNMNPQIVQLPEGDDPASFMHKESKENIEKYIKTNIVDFIDFKYSFLKSHETDDVLQVIKKIMISLSFIEDKIAQSLHVQKLSKLTGVSIDDLDTELRLISSKKEFTDRIKNKDQNTNNSSETSVSTIKKDNLEEYQLIRLLVNYGASQINLYDSLKETTSEFIIKELELDKIEFSVPVFIKIYREIKIRNESNTLPTKDYFLTHQDSQISNLTSQIIGEEHLLSNWQQKDIVVPEEKDLLLEVARESILRFKLKRVQEMRKEALLNLKRSHDSGDDQLKKFHKLNLLEKKIQKELGRLC